MHVALALLAGSLVAAPPPYEKVAAHPLPGDAGWDYLTFDAERGRLFVAHGEQIQVVDAASGKVLGTLPSHGAHGVALVPKHGRGFFTNGKAGTVTAFELGTLKVIGELAAGENPDAAVYDPVTDRVVVMEGRSKAVARIDPERFTIEATVDVGGKPEFAATDDTTLFVNIEDKNEVVAIDSKTWKVARHLPLAPCEEPTGLAIDAVHAQLFVGCGNEKIAIVELASGKVTTSAAGAHLDAIVFDAELGRVISSNGEGNFTVLARHDGAWAPLASIPTQAGARTLALDPKTHRLFTVTAELVPAAQPGQRPAPKPGTFTLLVFGAK